MNITENWVSHFWVLWHLKRTREGSVEVCSLSGRWSPKWIPLCLQFCLQSNLPLRRALSSKALWTQIPLVAAVVISSQVTSCDRFSCAFQSKSNTWERQWLQKWRPDLKLRFVLKVLSQHFCSLTLKRTREGDAEVCSLSGRWSPKWIPLCLQFACKVIYPCVVPYPAKLSGLKLR